MRSSFPLGAAGLIAAISGAVHTSTLPLSGQITGEFEGGDLAEAGVGIGDIESVEVQNDPTQTPTRAFGTSAIYRTGVSITATIGSLTATGAGDTAVNNNAECCTVPPIVGNRYSFGSSR